LPRLAAIAMDTVRTSAVFDRSEAAPMTVRCTDLVKHYEDVVAVAGIDLAVFQGECFGLLGPNGAGKTTTVEILEGLTLPDGGSVEVLGCRWGTGRDHELRERLGVQLQETQLAEKLTVGETLRLFASFFARPRAVSEVIGMVGLEDKRHARVGKLSGGQKQRLALACALVSNPELLFLDEPTTGLDPQARHLLWDRLYRLKQQGVTLIITTHYMDEAEQLCDRLVIMDRGRIVAEGSPRQLIERHSTREVLELRFPLGLQEEMVARVEGLARRTEVLPDRVLLYSDDADEAAGLLPGRGVFPESTVSRRSTLEDVFLRLTGRSLVE
jgi:lipooligosaccharide transport system ATP-binding protein